MSGANFASLHGGMLQRSDLPTEKAANPEKISVPDGVYGATGTTHHLSDEIASEYRTGAGRRDARPPADGSAPLKKVPTKEILKSKDLTDMTSLEQTSALRGLPPSTAKQAKAQDALLPPYPSKGLLQKPGEKKPLSWLAGLAQTGSAAHPGPLTNAGIAKRSAENARSENDGSEAEELTSTEKPASDAKAKRKALTLRLLPAEHRRLKMAGAFLERTSQDILVSAMDEYLKQLGFGQEK